MGVGRVISQESQGEGTGNANADDSPAGFDDSRVGHATASIPHQMTQAVEAVVGEGESQGGLEKQLGSDGEGTEGGSDGG